MRAAGALEATAEDLDGATVGCADPGGVDAQDGGSASAMAEPAGDRAQVHPGDDRFGGGVVAPLLRSRNFFVTITYIEKCLIIAAVARLLKPLGKRTDSNIAGI